MRGVISQRVAHLQQIGGHDRDTLRVHPEILVAGVPQARDEQRRPHDHGQRESDLKAREHVEDREDR